MTPGGGQTSSGVLTLLQDHQGHLNQYHQQPLDRPSSHAFASNTINSSTGGQMKQCKLCSYKTFRTGHLKRHMLSHSGEKPIACLLCPYRCIQNSDLQKHMTTHGGPKLFKCSYCSYQANSQYQVKQHFSTHHAAA